MPVLLLFDRMLARLAAHRRILLTGAPGVGKSTLARQLATELAARGRVCATIGCDPGSPAFGFPGAVCAARWLDGDWALVHFEPLCSLDAVRFRLPLVQAVARTVERLSCDALLVDAPGTVRGAGSAELIAALAASAAVDAIIALERAADDSRHTELDGLRALGVAVYRLPAARAAHAPSRNARARRRTALWNAWLREARELTLPLDGLPCVGTPPPRSAPAAWAGRQIALLHAAAPAAVGEVVALDDATATLRVRGDIAGACALLVRDALRGADGLLGTAAAAEPAPAADPAPAEAAAPFAPRVRVGPFVATLVNGVFGDPLLLVRTRHARRNVLFDLGEATRLRARVVHGVTDVFLSHAHLDHIAGFVSFLRARIGVLQAVRVFGPPGIARNVAGLVAGAHWDRAGVGGPRFEIAELHGEQLLHFAVSTEAIEPLARGVAHADGGVLLDDADFCVRAVTLDHGTPVLAFALESRAEVNVRKERLAALGLAPGLWLGELKRAVLGRRLDTEVRLPKGGVAGARELAAELLLIRPGKKLVYATDLADTPANRLALEELARGAHTLFCEATFCERDAARAARTGHLTARACGEIATAAGVERLVPFHFSRRYESDPAAVYGEVRSACARTIVPRFGPAGSRRLRGR